eukprot:TRINITY_DN14046_c0_g1_i1.p1 TRINITY_DN14046_c0_g1~~TRINITY_DN14046_c0_g1_i1.p1  ORF type:complete len:1528 (+),score=457.91 TRINITY_DN14046_c0_g1_i1:247-4584(+)
MKAMMCGKLGARIIDAQNIDAALAGVPAHEASTVKAQLVSALKSHAGPATPPVLPPPSPVAAVAVMKKLPADVSSLLGPTLSVIVLAAASKPSVISPVAQSSIDISIRDAFLRAVESLPFSATTKFRVSSDPALLTALSRGYVHASVFQALALLHDHCNAVTFAEQFLEQYRRHFDKATSASVDWEPVHLYALARLALAEGRYTLYCALLSVFAGFGKAAAKWMDDNEKRIAVTYQEAPPPSLSAAPAPSAAPDSAQHKWDKMKHKAPKPVQDVMAKLFDLTGLETVKLEALQIYISLQARMAQGKKYTDALNFAFVGNPGTGKTEIAKLFAALLHATGARPAGKFAHTKAHELLEKPSDEFKKLIDDTMGGVIFVDEAYMLKPSSNAIGARIVTQILTSAEDDRDKISFILAGYKADIETELYGYNVGLASRFKTVTFEDYREDELKLIFDKMLHGEKWAAESALLSDVVAGKLGRMRGKKGFANARAVRQMLNAAINTAEQRLFFEADAEATAAAAPAVAAVVQQPSPGKPAPPPAQTPRKSVDQTQSVLPDFMAGFRDYVRTAKRTLRHQQSQQGQPVSQEWLTLQQALLQSFGDKVYDIEDDDGFDQQPSRAAQSNKQQPPAAAAPKQPQVAATAPGKPQTTAAAAAATKGLPVLKIVDVLGPPPTRANLPDLDRALTELDRMIGLTKVKACVYTIVDTCLQNYNKMLQGKRPVELVLNRVFFGNPGTGKTETAKIYGRILKALKLLADGSVEVRKASEFVGSAVGETPNKVNKICELSRNKVLLIDEAYILNDENYGKEALNTLLENMDGSLGDNLAVVMCGYRKEMLALFDKQNPGLKRRMNLDNAFEFDDYTDGELMRFLSGMCKSKQLSMDFATVVLPTIQHLARLRFMPNFGNIGTLQQLLSEAQSRAMVRTKADPQEVLCIELIDVLGPEKMAERTADPLAFLNGLVNADYLREQFEALQVGVEAARSEGVTDAEILKSLNFLFLGKPGTGKTTVARAMGQVLYRMGLLSHGRVLECQGSDLLGFYVHEGKRIVEQKMNEARGGILFVDEAYALGQSGLHSTNAKEAVDQLVGMMTSDECSSVVVIFAGYEDKMRDFMQHGNDGLASRFPRTIFFKDWDAEDSTSFALKNLSKNFLVEETVADRLREGFAAVIARPKWSNGRDVETIINQIKGQRATRNTIPEQRDSRPTIKAVDVDNAITGMLANRPEEMRDPLAQLLKRQQSDLGLAGPAMMSAATPSTNTQQQVRRIVEVKEVEQEKEAEVTVEQAQARAGDDDPLADAILGELEKAMKKCGYCKDIDEDIALLSQETLPRNVVEMVTGGAKVAAEKVNQVMKGQKQKLLQHYQAVKAAIEEEKRRKEEEEERARQAENEARREAIRKAQAQAEQQRQKTQQALRQMSSCEAGFSWIKVAGGYRCAGGSHHISDADLDRYMR